MGFNSGFKGLNFTAGNPGINDRPTEFIHKEGNKRAAHEFKIISVNIQR